MKHAHLLFALATVFASATALAGDEYDKKHAGEKGYVTAYEADKAAIIDVDKCPVSGRLATPDYVACGKPFRDRIKSLVCTQKGAGKHVWYYRIGNSTSFSTQTTNCK